MKEKKPTEPDINFTESSTLEFLEYYNKNVPEAFPRASVKALERFQIIYPGLFKDSLEWTIDKHRKRLMDWLASYRGEM